MELIPRVRDHLESSRGQREKYIQASILKLQIHCRHSTNWNLTTYKYLHFEWLFFINAYLKLRNVALKNN